MTDRPGLNYRGIDWRAAGEDSPHAATQERWVKRPVGSTWGDFGPDDQLGRLNLVTPERVRAAVSEVRAGKVFCLSLPLNYPGGKVLAPRRQPPILRPGMRNGQFNMNFPVRCEGPTATDIACDDVLTMSLQYSTQWDSLAHIGQMFDADGDGIPEDVYYNGFRPGVDVVAPDETEAAPDSGMLGARRLGIENMAASGVQGRGVLIDLYAHFGRSGRLVGFEELMMVLEKDKVVVEEGDFVCFRSGFDQLLLSMKGAPDRDVLFNTTSALDGRDPKLLQWVTDCGAVALISDTYAVEAQPATASESQCCSILPLHEHCLFKLGVYLGELWFLSDLADWLREQDRNRFLLTAPPLRLPGAVGSPVTPIATV